MKVGKKKVLFSIIYRVLVYAVVRCPDSSVFYRFINTFKMVIQDGLTSEKKYYKLMKSADKGVERKE